MGNYNNFMNYIPIICNNVIEKTYNQYCENNLYFKDAFHSKYHNEFLISKIGYPLDSEKLILSYNNIPEGEYSVNISPAEYIQSNGLYKKFDGYKITIEFKKKEIYLQKK
jgi:hypothetical protein